ncbi:hypothetical protein F441_02910 [Phytophthora nicotianae CJ01A1]|uniref:Uncharacterized protein n=3 Tax=Phytophthora nicotianae TaxID=4792 RepID=W2HHP3_PHYNI|nr:hypothetical protein L915_02803 [Phytophthora nicotianae]ETO82968.1 hypothetical protein F444_02946 [Phytophthora nicotianae P1976]ETP24041.1 hypothetical protein F441_02910 [Phytophthora nicotianae CJ01A1]ETL47480.1 hypothetical protein L916_02778 [Phytophthora nicotianae]ETM00577.1 hypothetical protein L917_02712 [Phytophthora nicotianae]
MPLYIFVMGDDSGVQQYNNSTNLTVDPTSTVRDWG